MAYQLAELTERDVMEQAYSIYRYCMYLPTEEKFDRIMDTILNDPAMKMYVCLSDGEIKGAAVVSLLESDKIEIIGIAVDARIRGQGIGSFMIHNLSDIFGVRSVFAETDCDAVGFYRKCGFAVTEMTKIYDGEAVVRYFCERVTDAASDIGRTDKTENKNNVPEEEERL